MTKSKLFILLTVLMLPLFCFAQENAARAEFDAYIADLNSRCPMTYRDGWAVNSFTTSGDSAIVEIQVPSGLSMFLSSLTENTDNVKQMWLRQLSMYGDEWNELVDRIVAVDRIIVVALRPEGTQMTYPIIFMPEDFKKAKPAED